MWIYIPHNLTHKSLAEAANHMQWYELHLNSVFFLKIQEIPLYHLHKSKGSWWFLSGKSRGSINIFWSKFYRDLCIWLSIIATTSVISIHGYLWVKVRETGRLAFFQCHTVFILWRKAYFFSSITSMIYLVHAISIRSKIY